VLSSNLWDKFGRHRFKHLKE